MVQINQVRIGNYIQISGGRSIVSNVSASFTRTINGYSEEQCEPIPLTPEILEKCGFIFDGKRHYELPEFPEEINGIMSVGVCLSEHGILFQQAVYNGYYMGVDIKIESLHQLQNIHHAITGHELEVKL